MGPAPLGSLLDGFLVEAWRLRTSLLVTAAGTKVVPSAGGPFHTRTPGTGTSKRTQGQRFDFCTRQGLTPGSWCAITCAFGPIIALSGDCYA
ncbi:hypothetical protein SY2F82_11830 [Streptomyces sp. Y2F8-2]|nr:hypothetical protein SY2F82_11830 [Streptomyces sp. Y2F8-2]